MSRLIALPLLLLLPGAIPGQPRAAEPPREFVDPTTGHKVIRLSTAPDSNSFYFHQNSFTADGDKMVYGLKRGLAVVNWKTRETLPLIERNAYHPVVGRKSREVFYTDGDTVMATHVDTRITRTIAKLPLGWSAGGGMTINADETLLAGSYTGKLASLTKSLPRAEWFVKVYEAHLPSLLYTVNIKSGEVKTFHRSDNWFNHVQFSPTEPNLVMFCHEGPWESVDRIWTVRTDGSGLKKMFTRSMPNEVVGREFWAADGRTIWYEQQSPKDEKWAIGGVDLKTGKKTVYPLEKERRSQHLNVSRDGKMFAGDGSKDGQFIYLFQLRDGKLRAHKMVDLKNQDYKLEPNVNFTPDGQWIVFRSNMHGAPQVYAVQTGRPKQP